MNSTRRRRANDPNAANRLTWGSENQTWVMANAEGITIAARTERLITSRSGSLVLSHRAAERGRPRADTGGAAASVISLCPSSRSRVGSANPRRCDRSPEDDGARSGDSVPRDGRRGDPSRKRSRGISPVPGMGRSLQTGNSLVVSQFHAALLHQLFVVLLVVVVCRGGVQRGPHGSVPTLEGRRADCLPYVGPLRARATGPEGAPLRLRGPVDPRRPAADPVVHAARSAVRGDRTVRRQLADVGPASGEQRRDHLVRPSRAGGGRHRLDPGRAGRLAARGSRGAGGPASGARRAPAGVSSSGCSASPSGGSSLPG